MRWSILREIPWGLVALAMLTLNTRALPETLEDAYQSEAKRKAFTVEILSNMIRDRSVEGSSTLFNGTKVSGRENEQKNQLDGLNFQSPLTNHKNPYRTYAPDPASKDPKNPGVIAIPEMVSEHGALPQGSGSSDLEQAMWNTKKALEKKDDEDTKKKSQQDLGKFLYSIFEIETRDVKKKDILKANANNGSGSKPGTTNPNSGGNTNGGGNNNNNSNGDDTVAVQRWKLRDEARKEAERIGTATFDPIAQKGRDPQNRSDANALPSRLGLTEVALRAYDALERELGGTLAQRRFAQGIPEGGLRDGVQLQEGLNNCDQWRDQASKDIAKASTPAAQDALKKEIDRGYDQCKSMAQVRFDAINPRFEKDDKTGKEVLKTGKLEEEDALQRDLRNQMAAQQKIGIRLNKLQTNFQYDPKDEQVEVVTQFDSNNNPLPPEKMRVDEQLEFRNEELRKADKGWDEVLKRAPDLKKPDILQYIEEPGTARVQEVVAPNEGLLDDFGGRQAPTTSGLNNFEDLQKSLPKVQ